MQPKASTTKNNENPVEDSSSGPVVAHYNSDTDDWTFVSSASSGGGSRGSSNSSSPERATTSSNNNSPVRDTATTALLGTPAIKQQASVATTATATGNQQSDSTTSSDHPLSQQPRCAKKHISHHKRKLGSCERADDADDESDGMTEINLSDNNDDSHALVATASSLAAIASTNEGDLDYDALDRDGEELHTAIQTTSTEKILTGATPTIAPATTSEGGLVAERKSISTSTEPPSRFTVATISNESTQTHEGRFRLDSTPTMILIQFIMVALVLIGSRNQELFGDKSRAANASTSSGAPMPVDASTFDSVYLDPTNHAHTELKLMHEEMIECIRRENPNRREIEHWLSMNSRELDNYHSTQTNIRPFKGLVCYNNEVEWRKRFNRLKAEFSLDLRKVTRQIKRKITNEMLEREHPAMSFRLVLNQLEYLDHIDQRRKDRALEKLKAENLELVRRINKKSSELKQNKSYHQQSGHHQHHHEHHKQHHKQHKSNTIDSRNALVILESENGRLKHEVELLRARLAEKAGTVYIKQSLELEKCDRENTALRQFHQQVAQEVARNLKQLDHSHSMESLAIFEREHDDDDESLSSRLASTRASLLQLGEGVTKLVARNKALENDLKEAQSAAATAMSQHAMTVPPETQRNLIEDANQTGTEPQAPSARIPTPADYHPPTLNHHSRAYTVRLPEDWLTKRGKLREKLRKTADSEQRHYVETYDESLSEEKEPSATPPRASSEGDSSTRAHARAPKACRKRRSKSNSYNRDSHRNCKHNHRRDEL